MLLLVDDRHARFDDLLLVGKELFGQHRGEEIEIAFALHFRRRLDAERMGVRRIIQHKPPLFVLGINVVRQIIYHQLQQIPLALEPRVFLLQPCNPAVGIPLVYPAVCLPKAYGFSDWHFTMICFHIRSLFISEQLQGTTQR